MKKIVFVCSGNICRSPTTQAIASHFVKELKLENQFYFESRGLISYHAGEPANSRAVKIGARRNISFANIFARQIESQDFDNFDLILTRISDKKCTKMRSDT